MAGIRYDFGKQWNEYADRISEEDLSAARAAFEDLLPAGFVPNGKSLLDIGCGTGIHAVAAYKSGFSKVVAIDYYEGSVSAAQKMASKAGAPITVKQGDILDPDIDEQFDVVYSWGVLHHTGNMQQAIANAASYVRIGGIFIISIYLKTPLCGFWKVEKRAYTLLPRPAQAALDYAFRGLMIALKAVDGKQEKERGMDWRVGVRDWLGGYPYESATPQEVVSMVGEGFELIEARNTTAGPGVLGTVCAEYIFRRDR